MPIMIQFRGPHAVPQIMCDYCGDLIENAEDGNYQWNHAGGCEEGQLAPVYFTHKRCCHDFEQEEGPCGGWSAVGLQALPFYLVKNLHTTWTKVQASGRMMVGL